MSTDHPKSVRPKVLHVLRSSAWGGLESYTLDYIVHHQDSNHFDNYLLCLPHTSVFKEAQSRRIPILTTIRSLWRNWDIIHVHQRQDLFLARLGLIGRSKIRFWYTLMMNAPPKRNLHHRWIYRRLNRLFSSSPKVVQDARTNFPLSHSEVACYLPYGRNFEWLNQVNLKRVDEVRSQTESKNRLVLGTICRIDKGKGIEDLIQSLDHLSPESREKIQFWIIGNPTQKSLDPSGNPIWENKSVKTFEIIQSYCHKYPKSLYWFPYQKDPRPYYHAMDLFILASHEETYSLAVLEAMACGKTVVGTNCGGTPYQLGHGERGYLFKPNDPHDLAKTIEMLLKTNWKEKGEKAQDWVLKEHSWSHHDHILKESGLIKGI